MNSMWLWYANAIANLALCLWLLGRGHYLKYRVLFASLIYELFAFSVLLFTYRYFGTNSGMYSALYEAKKMVTIAFSIGVVFEAWRWCNSCVRVPQEIYLVAQFAFFLTKKAQLLTAAHGIHEVLRWANLAIVLWWLWCFRGEFRQEKRKFR